ncbi:uncharacterized protein LOC124815791 [Hydra vulgaris]|uniref:uncharacterized protein LOC124815791 n=1 Tax=Hydra vulgaris TaxID=6087 RepID=UPI001F5ED103|nr:uncharacterized protein LOC124815791 [Hydra vulgaris]
MIREENLDKISSLKIVVHFDTKILKRYNCEKGVSKNENRIAISASSPESGPLDFFLGILEIESSNGSVQATAIQAMLEYYEMSDQIIGLCSDTTSSNTGRKKGAISIIISYALGRPVLWLMCRHHIYEKHVAHVIKKIFGQTNSPSRKLYVTFQKIWPQIYESVNKLERIVKFNWTQDAFRHDSLLYKLASNTKEFCTTALGESIFQRGDYRYLCGLLVFFLGAQLPNFSFKQPGAYREARFMANCIYLLVIQMTQMYYLVDSESGNITMLSNLKAATNYIVFFHGFFFLKCAMASQAPSNDLMAFNIAFELQTMDEFKEFAVVGKVLYQSLTFGTNPSHLVPVPPTSSFCSC